MWQEWFFTASGLFFAAALMPSCLSRSTEVPRSSSIPTATIIALSAVVWCTLGMWFSAAASVFTALTWAFLAIRRPIRPEPRWGMISRSEGTVLLKGPVTIGEPFELREGEQEIVVQYRQWQRDQQLRRTLAAELEREA